MLRQPAKPESLAGLTLKQRKQDGLHDNRDTHRAREDNDDPRDSSPSRNVSLLLGDEEASVGNICKTPPRRHKMIGLWELGEPSTHPRRSVRISVRTSQVRDSSHSCVGTNFVAISDGDINNCNSRYRESEYMEEPSKLWEIDKHIGVACRGDEVEVVKEFQCMEVRDLEVMQSYEEGNKSGYLC